ncbi:MAG: protein kinase [Planctomycetota bacterium]
MPQTPQKKIGPYVVEGVLGKGCMGVVYKVRHPKLDSTYALKVLRSELGSERDLKRFKREIELLAAISEHPNVVKIHTAAEDRGRIYYVMDLIEGEDLQAKLKHGPLPPQQAARYVQQVASAVAVLHQKGILHRDIKPANVIVDDRDRARLSDFGLARSFTDDQSRLTRSGEFVGTPLFMAPEQATGAGAGPEADVYALGMVLYTLLAGHPAIQGPSTAEVLQKLRAGQHVPLRKVAPDVPPVLADLVMRALSMDPRTRPRDAGQLARELGRFVEERVATTERSREQRQLVLALIVAGVVVLGVGAVAVVLLGGGDDPAAAASADEGAADAALEAGQAALDADAPPPDALFARLQAARTAIPSDDSSASAQAKLGELWALEGELWLRAGDTTRARACLTEAEAIADPKGATPLRNLARRGLGALKVGLAALDPRPEDDLVELLQALQAAERASGDRAELHTWRVLIAARFERWDEAQKALDRHPSPEQVPAATRIRIFLEGGDLERAESLVGEVDDAALLGSLRYRQGLDALRREDWEGARVYFEEAVRQDPDHPERQRAITLARERYREASDWQGSSRSSRLARLVQREVTAARALDALDPQFELPGARFDVIFRAMPELGRELEGETLPVLEALIQLRPRDLTLYKLYGEVAQEWFFPEPERELELLREGYTLASHPRDKEQLAKNLAQGYYLQRKDRELIALEQSLPEGVRDSRRAFVLARAADLRRYQGDLESAASLLERARKLERDNPEVALFGYWLAKARLLNRDDSAHALAVEEARRFLQLYPGYGWHDVLPEVCSWLAKVEANRGDPDAAVAALDRLREFRPDQVQWGAYRLQLLAAREPWPDDLVAQVDQLREGLTLAIDAFSDRAQQEPGAVRETLKERIDALRKVSTLHLEQAAATHDQEGLIRGLQGLQQTLTPLLEELPR